MMKNITKIASGLSALAFVATAIPASVYAWGPSRTTYTMEHPADRVVFNSITNNPKYGDERNFAHIKESAEGNEKYRNSVNLTPGKTYDVFVYYHNNASDTLNASGVGVAKGAYARVEFPGTVKGNVVGNVRLGATNATPKEVFDEITFKSVQEVTMRYVPGSAQLHNFAKPVAGSAERTFSLSDNLFGANGTLIGFDQMDGVLPGCNYYSGYITFQVSVDKSDFSLQKQVRIKGETEWKENVNAKVGDIVEYQLTYRNTGNTNQTNVKISDKLPAGLTYVAGSTKIKDGARPSGAGLPDGITSGGLIIGSYAPNAAAYVIFEAKVTVKDDNLVCGANKINNVGKVTVDDSSKEDGASVTVNKDCEVEMCDIPGKEHLPKNDPGCKEEEKEMCDIPGKTHLPKNDPGCKEDKIEMCDVAGKTHLPKNDPDCYDLPVTGASSAVSGIIGMASLATAGTYFIRSRKQLN